MVFIEPLLMMIVPLFLITSVVIELKIHCIKLKLGLFTCCFYSLALVTELDLFCVVVPV